MKKISALATTLAVAVVGFVLLNGCNKQAPTTTTTTPVESGSLKSAETNSFKEVTAKLDPGGDLYLYVSTEQWLKNLSGTLEKWRGAVDSMPNLGDNQQAITNGFNVVTRLIKDSGVEDISGIGMSSIAREPGTYYNKIIVHHYSGQGNGFIWTIFGEQPHELGGLDLLPANTALAMFNDVDVPGIWSVVQKECEQSGFPQASEFLDNLPQQFEKGTGLKWNDVLDSLGGEFGVVMTLDESKMVTVPAPTSTPLQIPDPALMVVVKVKNDTIFNRLDELLKKQQQAGMISTDKDGVKMRTVPVPIPVGITLRPSIATSQGYLFLATSDALIQEALAVKGGKAGLKSTDEFKKLMTGVPMQGNQFCFLSRRFGQTMMQIQQEALENNQGMPEQLKELVQSLMQPDKAGFGFSVGANTDAGWMAVGNGNQSGGKMLAAATVFPAGILAGIAVPNFVKARETAQKNACMNNLRLIDGAKQSWALENNKKATDVPTWDDIQPYLGMGKLKSKPRCPSGGEYTIGPVGELPRCSIPGHALPQS